MNLSETLYCKEYAQTLPPEYHLYAWILWFVGILVFTTMWYSYAMRILNKDKN